MVSKSSILRDVETLAAMVERLSVHGDRPAVVAFAGEARTWRYDELVDCAARLAAGLVERGVEPGTNVALYAPNGAEWVVANLALLWLGAVPVPLDVRQGKKNLAHCLKDSDARFACTTADYAPSLLEAGGEAQRLTLFLLDASREAAEASGLEAATWWRDLLAERPAERHAGAGGDTAVLFYTSGTTGAPKGVPLTHENVLANLEGLLVEDVVGDDERALMPLPLHHVYPYVVGMLVPFCLGAAVILPAGISGAEIARALREGRATVVMAVPRLCRALVDAIRRRIASGGRLAGWVFDSALAASIGLQRRLGWRVGRWLFAPIRRRIAPDLHLMVAGGSKLEPELAATIEALGWEVLTGYGLSETSPIVALNTPHAKNLESAGKPLPGVEVRIDPIEGKAGGEIVVRGKSVFSGYRDLPDKTRSSFTEDGWFRTGDLGELDEAGFLHIKARVKETIVLSAGENIFPEEVEEAFEASPLIAEAAVLERDDRLVLLAVADQQALRERNLDDTAAAVREAAQAIANNLPSYQRVADIAISRESLPRTTLGKLRRHELPDLFERAKAGKTSREVRPELSAADERLLAEPRVDRAWRWLEERFPDRDLRLDSDLATDLGIDSLDWVGLSLDLERAAGVHLDESTIQGLTTVRDLLLAVRDAETGAGEAATSLSDEQRRWIAPKTVTLAALTSVLLALDLLVMRLCFRLRVRGLDQLPEAGPCILTPNHASYLDAFAVTAALPGHLRRKVYWAGDREILFKSAPRRLFSRAANVFPVSTFEARSGLAFGREILERGDCLGWFPEGQLSLEGALQPFQPGIGQLAADTEVPLVPVHIDGAFAAWPRSRSWPRLRRIAVTFGAPLHPADLAGDASDDEKRERIAEALRRAVADLAA